MDTGPTLKLPDDMLRYRPNRFSTACGFVRRLILDQVMKSGDGDVTAMQCKHTQHAHTVDKTSPTHTNIHTHQFLSCIAFSTRDLVTAGVSPTPCLVQALLDGVHERASRLQQQQQQQQQCRDGRFSTNAESLLVLIARHDAEKGKEGTQSKAARLARVLLEAAVWGLLKSPHLFASYARPLNLSRALRKVRNPSRFQDPDAISILTKLILSPPCRPSRP